MMQTLYLSFTLPDGELKRIELKPDPSSSVLIGRNRASHIKLNLPSVSRQHAKIFYESGNYWIEDLGSSNGTFVNEEQIHHVRISPGDLVQCGEFEIEILSHAETSIYGAESDAQSIIELEDIEVIAETPIPQSATPSLEPRPRPQASKLSVPPPRAASPFSTGAGASTPRSSVHSKAPTNQPQSRPSIDLSTRPTVNHKHRSTLVDGGMLTSEEPSSQEQMTQLRQKVQSQAEELSNTQAQADAQRALVDKLKSEVQSLKAQRDQASAKHSAVSGDADLLRAELEALRGDLEQGRAQLKVTQGQLDQSKAEGDKLKDQIKSLKVEFKATQGSLEKLQSTAPSSEELLALTSERETLQAQLKTLSAERDQLKRSVAKLELEHKGALSESYEQLEAFEQARGEWATEQSALTTQVQSLEAQLKEQQAHYESALSQEGSSALQWVTPADWATHLARFDQLEHELKALRRAVKGQAVGGVRPNTRPPSNQGATENRPSIPPREQPREWRGLV